MTNPHLGFVSVLAYGNAVPIEEAYLATCEQYPLSSTAALLPYLLKAWRRKDGHYRPPSYNLKHLLKTPQKSRLNVATQWKLDITQRQSVVDVFCN